MRTTAENAELALLLDVTSTPKPGNVDRAHDHEDLRFEHFMAGAVGASEGLRMAAAGEPVGTAFERAVEGMANQRGGNTQFGALLTLVPLVAAARAEGGVTPESAANVVESTTVEDAAGFYRAFEHVDVAVDDPPDGMDALDVRHGADAIPTLRDRELTLYDVLAASVERDGLAREWVSRFPRSFETAERIESGDGPVPDRAARAYLELLASEPDTFVATAHDEATAREVCEAARAVRRGETSPETLADQLVAAGVNPGTTADLVAAGLFVALERGLDV
ncbi:triphosphoribosyl-dephospho-CoA synthase [Halococcus hamelinensis]|uniref:Triphosphoribosyl-dephospho-CoA protein n=2 Tax=Halococcus hamelinensis TaxID=332168 RepID=M0M341_9EURY|nr:triphosphoribosyl-dephospho-CoA synthase [Halococcus hamelinensis]EMA38999.1 triphosphoribosyl-dephospho-CoA protein [Halococcus hamelinensis 100A6]